MKIIVAKACAVSLTYRLFEVGDGVEELLAGGRADGIGDGGGGFVWQLADEPQRSREVHLGNHGDAAREILEQLASDGAITGPQEISAVVFQAPLGGDGEPTALVDHVLLERMEYFVPLAPVDNPPCIVAMRMFQEILPDTPILAAFDNAFHRTVAPRRRLFAVGPDWVSRWGIQRYGYDGLTHKHVADRMAQLAKGKSSRVISCHLGSWRSSVCAIREGQSVAFSGQASRHSGLPQAGAVGDFDVFALGLLQEEAGLDLQAMLGLLGSRSGLSAVSGISGDLCEVCHQAEQGHAQAQLAVELYVSAVRDAIGADLVELGGADAIVFSGSLAQAQPSVREAICQGLAFASIKLDGAKNKQATGEARISAPRSKSTIWLVPADAWRMAARQGFQALTRQLAHMQQMH